MEGQVHLSTERLEERAAIQAHFERVKRLETIAGQYAKTGQGPTSDELKAKYFRVEAEQLLAEVRPSR